MSNAAGDTTFSITGTKRYVPVATLLTDDNSKLLKQLKSGLKWTNTWNKYQLKVTKKILKRVTRLPNWIKFSRS